MIYLIGLDSDRTFRHFARVATEQGIELQMINLRAIAQQGNWSLNLPIDKESWIHDGEQQIYLDPNAAYYCRLIDLSSVQTEPHLAARWRNLLMSVSAWLEMIPGKVVNRPGFRNDNNSKPLHELCLQYYGFKVADSLTSADPQQLYEFASAQPTIVKAISGVRADSRLVEAEEFLEFSPSQGPVHLQKFIKGEDVRVHVVGDRYEAERVNCPTVDYRRDHDISEHFPHHPIPEALAQKIIKATQAFGLTFAGWDFKLTADGEYYCLEANPMPGYDGYDRRCDHKITHLLLSYLHPDAVLPPAPSAANKNLTLTPAECQQVYQTITSLEQHWLSRGRKDYLFCSLGAASYLDFGPCKDPNDTYWDKAARYNPILKQHFSWLYERVKQQLEALLNAPVAYRADTALPGFHLWLSNAIPTRPLTSMHCDLQYQHLNWPSNIPIDFSKTLSFTLPIVLPATGGGLELADFNQSEFLSITKYNNLDWQLIPRFLQRSYHAYQAGQMVLHSGYTLHRVAATSTTTPTDKRITLQGHAVLVEGTWQLYW
ncbi:MAG: RimK family alpha-L-glutamate ligase [Phormidesmis sp.]